MHLHITQTLAIKPTSQPEGKSYQSDLTLPFLVREAFSLVQEYKGPGDGACDTENQVSFFNHGTQIAPYTTVSIQALLLL